MAERIIVRQNHMFETEILAADPHVADADHLHPVVHVHELTPYGLMLSGLAACTAIVLHTYAQHHGLDLHKVELRADYDRVFAEDCEDCEGIEEYKERIEEEILLFGDLMPEERKRLFMVSKHCPIHKIISHGIEVNSYLGESSEPDDTD
jgi:uncharacterized OsmC-like protein